MGVQEGVDTWAYSPNKMGKGVSSAACEWLMWLKPHQSNNESADFSQFNNSAWVISFRGHRWWKAKARILKAVCFQMECWAERSPLMPVDYIQDRYQRRHRISLSQRDGSKCSSSYREALLYTVKTDCTSTGWHLHLEATKGLWLHSSVHSNKQPLSCDYTSTCVTGLAHSCDHTPPLKSADNLSPPVTYTVINCCICLAVLCCSKINAL